MSISDGGLREESIRQYCRLLRLPTIGGQGAAIAAIICSLAIFSQLAFYTARLLRHPPAESGTTVADPSR